MNDDQIRSELERRAGSTPTQPDWAKRVLLPAVWREVDARPQPVVTSRWPSLAGVAALVAALLILVLAVPRLAPQPPAASHSQSAFPTPTTPLSASGPTYMCTGPDWEGGAIELTDHLGVIESCLATRGGRLEERTVVSEISRGVVGVAWQGPCADGASLDLWSREDSDDRPRYVLTIESKPLDPPRDCLAIAGIAVEVTFMNAELAPENLASDLEAHLMQDGRGSDRVETSAGEFDLTLSSEATQYSSDDPIDIQAQLFYEGDQPNIDVSGVFSLVNGFGVEQLDGDLGMGPGWEEPCVLHQLQSGELLTVQFEKSAGWSQDDPNADFYRAWSADPLLHLPVGTWLVTAYSDFMIGNGCSGERVNLEASIVITVVDGSQATPTPTSSAVASRTFGCGPGSLFVDETGLVESCMATQTRAQAELPLTVSNPGGDQSLLEITYAGGYWDLDQLLLRRSGAGYELVAHYSAPINVIGDAIILQTQLRVPLSAPVSADAVTVTFQWPTPEPSPSEPQTILCPDDTAGAGPVQIEDHATSVIGCTAGSADAPVEDKVTLGTDTALVMTWMAPCAVDPLDTRIDLWYREPSGDPSDPSRFQPPYLLVVNRSDPTEPYPCLDAVGGRQVSIQLQQAISPAEVDLFFTFDGIGAASAEVEDGANSFHLKIASDKPGYTEGEPINVAGTLISELDATVTGLVGPMLGFEQLDGVLRFDPGPFVLLCPGPTDLTGGIPRERTMHWPSDWSAGDPNAPFYDNYLRDGELFLPAGTYRFYAFSEFSLGDTCRAGPVRLEASIVVSVR